MISAQQSPPSKPDDGVVRLSTELVVLDAMVLEKATNRPVAGLTKDNFAIFEDDVRQPVESFSQGERPLAVMFLIDTSKTVWDTIGMLRTNVLEAQFHLRPQDQLAIMVTAEKTDLIQDFTRDRVATGTAIRNFNERKYGEEGIFLHDAIARAVLQMRKTASREARKVIIVVTDNVAMQTRHLDFFSEKEAGQILFESDVAVCGLVVPNRKEGLREAWRRGFANPKLSPGSVFDYAEKTGGEALKTDAPESGKRLGDLLDRLRARYTLGYESTNPARSGKFRKLRIEFVPTAEHPAPPKGTEYVIRARRGYVK